MSKKRYPAKKTSQKPSKANLQTNSTSFEHGSQRNPLKRNSANNKVRIIGGRFKSRQISFVNADGLRPTPDRVRETVFNWLMPYLFGATVLDACAGSGAFGFEAVSRGASHCTFIEANRLQSQCIQNTAQQLGLTKNPTMGQNTMPDPLTPTNTLTQTNSPSQPTVQMLDGEAQTLIPALGTAFDLVFIDPPYALNLWQPILTALLDTKRLNPHAIVYLEAPLPLDALALPASILHHFEHLKEKKMGGVYGHLLKLQES